MDSQTGLSVPAKRWTNSLSCWLFSSEYWMEGNGELEGVKPPYCSRGTTVINSVEAVR